MFGTLQITKEALQKLVGEIQPALDAVIPKQTPESKEQKHSAKKWGEAQVVALQTGLGEAQQLLNSPSPIEQTTLEAQYNSLKTLYQSFQQVFAELDEKSSREALYKQIIDVCDQMVKISTLNTEQHSKENVELLRQIKDITNTAHFMLLGKGGGSNAIRPYNQALTSFFNWISTEIDQNNRGKVFKEESYQSLYKLLLDGLQKFDPRLKKLSTEQKALNTLIQQIQEIFAESKEDKTSPRALAINSLLNKAETAKNGISDLSVQEAKELHRSLSTEMSRVRKEFSRSVDVERELNRCETIINKIVALKTHKVNFLSRDLPPESKAIVEDLNQRFMKLKQELDGQSNSDVSEEKVTSRSQLLLIQIYAENYAQQQHKGSLATALCEAIFKLNPEIKKHQPIEGKKSDGDRILKYAGDHYPTLIAEFYRRIPEYMEISNDACLNCLKLLTRLGADFTRDPHLRLPSSTHDIEPRFYEPDRISRTSKPYSEDDFKPIYEEEALRKFIINNKEEFTRRAKEYLVAKGYERKDVESAFKDKNSKDSKAEVSSSTPSSQTPQLT